MRLLILLISAFVTALGANGQAARAADGAQIAASLAGTIEAKSVVHERRADRPRAERWYVPCSQNLALCTVTPAASPPLYADRLRI